jgi:type II secretory ATPase GspE/PulE/Tfp pilus assembly ATPase PilB-like protein
MNTADRLLLKHYTKDTRKIQVKYGIGCTMCRGTGFLDRVGAYQIFEITDEMRELISTRPNPSEIYELAEEEGLRTLADEAFDLVLAGKTTLSEASSVIGTDV